MNTDKRRIFLVLGALALIAILVVGAIELATDKGRVKEPEQPVAAQPDENVNTQAVSTASSDTAGQTSSAATGPVAPADGQELPSTGPSSYAYVLALSLLALSGAAYMRSRKRLHQGLLSVR